MPHILHHARLRLSVAALAALAALQGAQADIYVRDDGDAGITLTNLPGEGGRLAASEAAPGKAPPAAPALIRPGGRPTPRERLSPLIAAAAAAYSLPEALLAAVIEVESDFNPAARSPKGALGPMQLMPGTARHLNVTNPTDPAANIDAGARYLKELLESFGNDLHLAVAAYNAGPAAVRRNGAIPPYAETRHYVPRVIRRYHSLASGNPTPR